MVTVCQLARWHNSEHFNPKKHRCENIKSRRTIFFYFCNRHSVIINGPQCYWIIQNGTNKFRKCLYCKPEYLHITSNHVIRQAVGSRFVQHDHQKDRIEEQCERPLKAVKSFSQWGAQLLGSVHSHFYEYCDSICKKYDTWFCPLKKKTRWLETRRIKHCPGNSHKFWICEASSI
jgi:hypothetical protein